MTCFAMSSLPASKKKESSFAEIYGVHHFAAYLWLWSFAVLAWRTILITVMFEGYIYLQRPRLSLENVIGVCWDAIGICLFSEVCDEVFELINRQRHYEIWIPLTKI